MFEFFWTEVWFLARSFIVNFSEREFADGRLTLLFAQYFFDLPWLWLALSIQKLDVCCVHRDEVHFLLTLLSDLVKHSLLEVIVAVAIWIDVTAFFPNFIFLSFIDFRGN